MTPLETILEAKFEDLLTKIAELEAEIKFLQLNPRPVETLNARELIDDICKKELTLLVLSIAFVRAHHPVST